MLAALQISTHRLGFLLVPLELLVGQLQWVEPIHVGGLLMKVVVRLSAKQEARALPILLRHSPGIVLPDHTYVIREEAARALREAGIEFTELGNETNAPGLEGIGSGESI
jgi:hypothetical protein